MPTGIGVLTTRAAGNATEIANRAARGQNQKRTFIHPYLEHCFHYQVFVTMSFWCPLRVRLEQARSCRSSATVTLTYVINVQSCQGKQACSRRKRAAEGEIAWESLPAPRPARRLSDLLARQEQVATGANRERRRVERIEFVCTREVKGGVTASTRRLLRPLTSTRRMRRPRGEAGPKRVLHASGSHTSLF